MARLFTLPLPLCDKFIGAPFTPLSLGDDLKLWLRPEELGADESEISNWPDQSGNGNDATQGTQASMPLVQADVLDGYAGALFDGVNDSLSTTVAGGAAFEVHVIVVPRTMQNNTFIGCIANSGKLFANASGRVEANVGASLLGANENIAADVPVHIGMRHDPVSGSIYLNGVDAYQGATGANSLTNVLIGQEKSDRWYAASHFLEIVLSTAALSTDNRANLMIYLASRYPTVGL